MTLPIKVISSRYIDFALFIDSLALPALYCEYLLYYEYTYIFCSLFAPVPGEMPAKGEIVLDRITSALFFHSDRR